MPEQFKLDLEVERASVAALNKGVELARSLGDNGSRHLLEDILRESESHVNWLEAQLTLIQQVGDAAYLAEQIKD